MTRCLRPLLVTPAVALMFILALASVGAQDRLSSMPGYDQFSKMSPQVAGSWMTGAVAATWAADGRSFTYTTAGKSYEFDLATLKAVETGDAPPDAGRGAGRGGRQAGPPAGTPPAGQAPPTGRGRSGGLEQQQTQMTETAVAGCPNASAARGRQVDCEVSPDGKLKAFYRDRNLWVANADGTGENAGHDRRQREGRASSTAPAAGSTARSSSQTTAMWWSPDSTKVGYYRFDEKPGARLLPADGPDGDPERGRRRGVSEGRRAESDRRPVRLRRRRRRSRTQIDVRDGKPFDNDVVGHYVYNVRWSPDGTELLFNRTNRRQNILEFVACAPGDRRSAASSSARSGRPAGSRTGPSMTLPRRTASASSGSRSATAGRTSICTT